MPNRIIRESLLDSDRYHGVPHDSERLLFLELLLLADDYGIVPMNFAFLRRRTTPCAGKSLDVVTAMVSALADQDLIRVYQSERGGQFAYIPRFGNSPRSLKPKWPLPPDGLSLFEIKNLQEKRMANATRLHANAPETETETETETNLSQNIFANSAVADSASSAAVLEKPVTEKFPRCPIDAVIDAYHVALPALPRVEVRNATRDGLISARWRQLFADGKAKTKEEGIALFRDFFAFCQTSKFLTGRVPSRDKDARPFMADLQWLMGPTNFAKTVEGRYHR